MSSKSILILATAAIATALLAGCGQQETKPLTYQTDIKPILDQYCVECHKAGGQGTEKSGLQLDTYAATMRGTKFGPVVIAGQSINSTLYRLVSGKADPSLRMPHNQAPLSDENINKIKDWIDQGAKEQ
ncbi:MAG: c-type cytochrome domain-containing protein [Pseudomonadota bacterium]